MVCALYCASVRPNRHSNAEYNVRPQENDEIKTHSLTLAALTLLPRFIGSRETKSYGGERERGGEKGGERRRNVANGT